MSIRPLCEVEKEKILEAIIVKGSLAGAAQALGISQTTIYRKIKAYGLALKMNEILEELRRQQTFPAM